MSKTHIIACHNLKNRANAENMVCSETQGQMQWAWDHHFATKVRICVRMCVCITVLVWGSKSTWLPTLVNSVYTSVVWEKLTNKIHLIWSDKHTVSFFFFFHFHHRPCITRVCPNICRNVFSFSQCCQVSLLSLHSAPSANRPSPLKMTSCSAVKVKRWVKLL